MTKSTLLKPNDHSLILIDHQYLQLLTVKSDHPTAEIVNNAAFLAKSAKIFGIPTLFTTAYEEKQSLIKEIQAVLPEQKPIDRSGLNAWDDERVVHWAKQTNKKKIVMAGLWTDICLSFAVISALEDGYDVYFVADASGGSSKEAHHLAIQRMIQAGAIPITTLVYLAELQRDWKNPHAEESVNLFSQVGDSFAQGLQWQWQLLSLKEGTR